MLGNAKTHTPAIVAISLVVPMVMVAQPGRGIPRPHEDRFVTLSQQIPGFGGFSFDSLGNLNVFLTDTTKASAARGLLAPILASRSKGRRDRQAQRPEILIQHGQFDFPTLRSWHDSLSMRALGLDGTYYTHLAEDRT